MPQQDSLSVFIAELRRRRVFRAAAFYGGIAFVIVQIIDGTFEVMGIPAWVSRLMITLLAFGFPIAMGLAWVFDITPDGILRTEGRTSARQTKPLTGNGALIAVAIAAVAFGIWGRWGGGRSAREVNKKSVAVMPFDNLTNDADLAVWSRGVPELFITALSGSDDLLVLDGQTLNDFFETIGLEKAAQINPPLVSLLSDKLGVGTIILGSILKSGDRLSILVKLLDAGSGEIFVADKEEGSSQSDIFEMVSTLSERVKNYLEIKVLAQDVDYELRDVYTGSAEAYRNYIEGDDFFTGLDYQFAIESFQKALAIDPNFTLALSALASANINLGRTVEARQWFSKAYERKDELSHRYRLELEAEMALLEKRPREAIRWIKKVLDLESRSRSWWFGLGYTYSSLEQFEEAAQAFENALELSLKWGNAWSWPPVYSLLGDTYHSIGQHRKEVKVYETGLKAVPDHPTLMRMLAVEYFSRGDTAQGNERLTMYQTLIREYGHSLSEISRMTGDIYLAADDPERAGEAFRTALALDSQNGAALNALAAVYIEQDTTLDEGLVLVTRAVELDPENPLYLHTYGRAQYLLGNFEVAAHHLEMAEKGMPYYTHKLRQQLELAQTALARD